MTATHGRPHDLQSVCGLPLAIRKATVPERMLDRLRRRVRVHLPRARSGLHGGVRHVSSKKADGR